MPVPFSRFRVINGTQREIQKVTIKRSDVAHVSASGLEDPEDIKNTKAGDIKTAELEDNVNYYLLGAKRLEISIQADDGGDKRLLDHWQIFYPDDPMDPEINFMTELEIAVVEVEGGGTSDLYARAIAIFLDGSTWEFASPYLPAV